MLHWKEIHVGLMLVILSPDFDLTNSLFMKRPIGCLYSRPLGALRLMNRSEVIMGQKVKRSKGQKRSSTVMV